MEKNDSADTLMIDLGGGNSGLGSALVELACKKFSPSGEIYELSTEAQLAIPRLSRSEALMKRVKLYERLYSNTVPLGGGHEQK